MTAPTPCDTSWLEACASGDLSAASAALAAGADPLSRDLTGHSALALAAVHGHEDLALWCSGVMTQADPGLAWRDWTASGGYSPLGLAILHRRHRLLSALLALPSPQRASAPARADTLAHMAVAENAPRALSQVLRSRPELLESVSSQGLTPLGLAIAMDKEDLVVLLLDAGARLEFAPPEALPAWAHVSSASMLDFLRERLEVGQLRLADGRSLLHALLRRGPRLRTVFCRAVVSRFPDLVGLADEAGRTPLHEAVRANADPAVVDVLLDKGAQWAPPDVNGETPLEILAQQVQAGWKLPDEVVDRWVANAHAQGLASRLPAAQAPGTPPARL